MYQWVGLKRRSGRRYTGIGETRWRGRPPFGTSSTIADTISRSWPSRWSPTNMSSQKFLSPAWRNGKIRDPTIRIRRYFHRPMIGTLTPYLKFASVRGRPRMGGERPEDAGRYDTLLPGFQSLGPPEPFPPKDRGAGLSHGNPSDRDPHRDPPSRLPEAATVAVPGRTRSGAAGRRS